MNTYRKMLNIFNTDKYLVMIFSGIIVSAIGLTSVIVTAGIWYL